MNTMTRWNPVSEFEDLLDRYNRYFGVARSNGERENKDLFRRSDWAPVVDIRETSEAFEIDAELPGLSRDDVKVTVHDGVLTIEGERRNVKDTGDHTQHRVERVYGTFLRRFTLPDNVDENTIQARFQDGVLHLTLNKAEPAKPRAIEVNVE
ncbi:MAG: Hsp20/alpha crystallin family protein [Marinobacter sp.]|nr:Hsp20/alpha crystallin family protein [Marinobacter sp.]